MIHKKATTLTVNDFQSVSLGFIRVYPMYPSFNCFL
jgi:hypothetical protein